MKSFLTFAAIFLTGSLARAQQIVDISQSDLHQNADSRAMASMVNGLVYSNVKFVKVTAGTPFFKEDWMKGTLVVDGGQAYGNLWLRLNLMDNEVNYKDANGQEMVASSPIKYISLTDSATGTKYEFAKGDQIKNIDRALSSTWFQLLVNDKKVSLCKQLKKSIHETIPYGTATTEEDIVTIEYYFVQMNNNFTRFRWDDWQEMFKDKKDELNAYIHSNHLKGKSSADFVKLITYYNTI